VPEINVVLINPVRLKQLRRLHRTAESRANFTLIMRSECKFTRMSEDWYCLLPKDDNQLLVELTRAFLSYLGVR
jgi:hypothetical protein